MSQPLAEFIAEHVLRPRLKEKGVLALYDPERRYRDLCLALADDRTLVVDATESSIESREAALRGLRALAQKGGPEGLVVYVPAPKPVEDRERLHDPFSVYIACGAVFPRDDSDEYLSLCLRARPDHATDVRRIFASDPNPAFAVIDNLGGGLGWPVLRAALGGESARDLLAALLQPDTARRDGLRGQDGWYPEAKEFLKATLGLNLQTRSRSLDHVTDELWRFLLFSEFAFDLPVTLPDALASIPHAPAEARPLVEDLCDQLRNDRRMRDRYIEKAEEIERALSLPAHCAGIADLGQRDTFPFEERTFLTRAITGFEQGDLDAVREVLVRRRDSVWAARSENQGQWDLVQAALALIEACDTYEAQLPTHLGRLDDLINFYIGSLREVDRLHRELEQAASAFLDPDGLLAAVLTTARSRYRRLMEEVQRRFLTLAESTGWPVAGRLANGEVFDRFVKPRLAEKGRKTAYFLIDALRYELGLELEKLLAEDHAVERHPACAQLPTITPVGMASLLPGARANLTLELSGTALAPHLAGEPVTNVGQRMDVLHKTYGDRFYEQTLGDFVRNKPRLPETIELLVLRSTEIDSHLETNPETALGMIPGTLKQIRAALHKLRGLGFTEAILATDHGFFLNVQASAGDVCQKPIGTWPVSAHDRLLLGDGKEDSHSLVMSAEKLGIRGAFAQAAVPRSLAPYRAGYLYFHGGLSLQEALVPLLVVKLVAAAKDEAPTVQVTLTYKNGATRITTRTPVIELSASSSDMFAQDSPIEVLIEAQDSKGNVVGEPAAGGDVNPATRTVTLRHGERRQVRLKMALEFEGKLLIKALHPVTGATFSTLALETDYAV